MKTQFYKGQKVWDPRHGWGVVADTQHHNDYPICVDFGTFTLSYTNDGRMYDVHKYPILSTQEYHRPKPQWIPQKGELVWVRRGNRDSWYARYFSHMPHCYPDRYCCFINQKKEGTVDDWPECVPFEPRPF